MYSKVADGARQLPWRARCGAVSTFQRETAQVHGQGIAQEVENALVRGEPFGTGAFDGLVDQLAVMRSWAAVRQICAVHREMQHVELECLPQAVGGKVASGVMSIGDACEQA